VPCDRYIVVHRDVRRIDGTNTGAVGFGIALVQGLGIPDRAYLHALTYIRIYDGHSFELIKQAAASIGNDPAPFQPKNYLQILGPVHETDVSAFPQTPKQGAANPAFRAAIRSLLVESLDKTLPAMLQTKSEATR
jgi:hypothetical protein